jgi:hypothetical protein
MMKTIQHLDDEELAAVISTSDERFVQHAFGTLPDALRSAVERPEYVWQRQHAIIQQRIAAQPNRKTALQLFAWATAAAVLALAVLLLRSPGASPTSSLPLSSDPDQQLLISVERAVRNDVPASLEPAALLAEEIAGDSKPAKTSQEFQQENKNED